MGNVDKRALTMSALCVGLACASCTLIVGYGDPVALAPPRDGGTIDEEGVPSPETGAEGSVPFCESLATKPTFCTGFDGPSYLAGWNSSDVTNVRLERDTSIVESAPASLRVSLE